MVLVLAGIVFLAVRGGRWRGKSRRWWLAGVILPVMMAAAACLAMAGIFAEIQRPAAVRVFLDLSGSTRGSVLRRPEFLRGLIEARLGSGRRVSVVGFGGDGAENGGARMLMRDVLAGDREEWPEEWPREVVDALGAVRTDVAGHGVGGDAGGADGEARWMVTDGLISEADVAADGGDEGLVAWTIIPATNLDAGVRDVQVRRVVDADGKPAVEVLAEVRVVGLAAGAAARVRAEFFRDGVTLASEIADFAGEAGGRVDAAKWISVRDDFGGDGAAAALPHHYAITVRLLGDTGGRDGPAAGGDLWPENDRGEAIWPGGGSGGMRVLVVGNRAPANMERFEAAEFVPAEKFLGDVRGWVAGGWQAIVLDDVPAESEVSAEKDVLWPISAGAAGALSGFVRQSGGGLLVLSNGHAFGPGHYGEGDAGAGDILENLSPVSSRPRTGGGLSVVYVLDASASMNEAVALGGAGGGGEEKKFALLARGVEHSAELLAAGDRVTLIAFNDHAQRLFSGAAPAEAADQAKLAAVLDGIRPAEATVPDAALDDISDAIGRVKRQGVQTLVILVTDGEIPRMDAAKWKSALAGEQFCVVAPENLAMPALQQVTRSLGANARWLQTDDPQEWGRLLTRRVAEQVRGDVQHARLAFYVDAAREGAKAGEPVYGEAHEWTQVWAKPEAELGVQGQEMESNGVDLGLEPLSAWTQRGLGRVGAIAMSDDGSQGYAAALRALLSDVAGAAGDRRFTLRAMRAVGGGWTLSADGVELAADSAGAGRHAADSGAGAVGFVDGQTLVARIFSGAGDAVEIPLEQTGPGHYAGTVGVAGGWSAAVIRKTAEGKEELIGRVQAADVQTAEWPASVDGVIDPAGVRLPVPGEGNATWNPVVKRAVDLSVPLWLIAVVAGLMALWLKW